MAIATNQHLYPFTLAFDEGLKQGTIDLETAGIFVDRVYEAWLEARVRANPALLKDAVYAAAVRTIKEDLPGGQ